MGKYFQRYCLLVILFLRWGGIAFSQSMDYQFVRYSAENGLSHNQVNCFLKDRQGFVWVGTVDGLNRFDGYSFKVFKHDPADTTTLQDHRINELFEDPLGHIWIHTPKGYDIYDPATERIDHNANKAAATLGLQDADFNRIIRTSKGDYWVSHNRMGLLKYISQQKRLIQVKLNVGSGRVISDFNEDQTGDLWVVYNDGFLVKVDGASNKITTKTDLLSNLHGTPSLNYRVYVDPDNEPWVYQVKAAMGIYYFDLKNNKLEAANTTSNHFRLNNNLVSAVITGADGKIWMGTDHGGINLVDKKKGTVSFLKYNPNDPKSISQNSVMALYKDASGMIWAGTFKRGFCNYHKSIYKFSLIRHLPSTPSSLPFDDVTVFTEDRKGNVWVGTNGGGLIYYDRINRSFKQYQNIPGDSRSLSNNVIVSMFLDHKGVLWLGTYFGGLNSFDGKSFKRYLHNAADSTSLVDDRVWEIFEDSQKRLWVGTLGDGLDLFDRERIVFKHFRRKAPNSINSDYISSMMEDKEGNIWIGTAEGIDILDHVSGKFIHYSHDPKNKNSLSSDAVTAINQDKLGNIWVGTSEGLNLFNPQTKSFKLYDTRDGLPDNSILTVVADNQNDLWMGTPKGLVNLHITKRRGTAPEAFVIQTYNEIDGLQGRGFNENAGLKMRSGELIFGGPNGFTIFDPKSLDHELLLAKVSLTDFQIFNKSVKPGESLKGATVLATSISQTDKIKLKHSQNVFSIEFAALNFLHPDKNHYLYTLEGFNDQWFEADNATRKVTYTNLDPGEYTFKVKIRQGDQFSPERILKIVILPPFWKTPWAYFLYALAIIGTLMMARWILLERERMNFRLEQERREAQQLHELDLMKIKFFTNVSHEFRTPLTLMLTPLEGLMNHLKSDHSVSNQLSLVHRNARRLLNLVTQLLDFKKMEVEETEYSPEKGDIVPFIREITNTFSDLSERKRITLSFMSPVDSQYVLFDPEKMSRIMYNLLSNAFKFTSENGRVSVELSILGASPDRQLQIDVKDSGIGIPTEDVNKVFDRFFQHQLPKNLVNQGSGIGLAITREFVKLHGGSIDVESTEGKGSVFSIKLPLSEKDLQPDSTETVKEVYPVLAEPDVEGKAQESKTKASILLVEDNDEFRSYMNEILSQDYQVFEAPNGRIGLEMTLDMVPDLIVSDVMMPEMDGMELCREVKTDPRISHIPVILLTARAEEEQQLQGYQTGADAYVTKPFRMDILQVRIKNLIIRRELVQKEFQKHIKVEPSPIEVQSLDEQFIQKAVKTVEEQMSNPEFTVEELSSAMAMSRVYLYKKLLSLTGKTPVEFIRIIRMRRAADLLDKSQITIAEIAYQVGFNNPKYFAKLFKEEYEVLPTEFRKRSVIDE